MEQCEEKKLGRRWTENASGNVRGSLRFPLGSQWVPRPRGASGRGRYLGAQASGTPMRGTCTGAGTCTAWVLVLSRFRIG